MNQDVWLVVDTFFPVSDINWTFFAANKPSFRPFGGELSDLYIGPGSGYVEQPRHYLSTRWLGGWSCAGNL